MDTKAQEKKKKRRKNPYGEGSIYQIENGRLKGKWKGQLIIGTNQETGKPVRRSFYGEGWIEVRDKMKLAKEELDKGINLQKQTTLTFGQWIESWMKNYKCLDLRLSTWENYDRQIKKHIIPALGNINFKELSTEHIQSLYTNMTEKKAAPASVRKVHQIILSCLTQAVQNKIISWNPAECTILPKMSKRKIRSLSIIEMEQFLSTLENDTWGIAMLTLIGTGLRQGELLALTWDKVDLRNKVLTITQSLMRTKKGLIFVPPKTENGKRIVPLPKEIAIHLRLHRIKQSKIKRTLVESFNKDNLVFCSSVGTTIIPRNFTRKFYSLREKARLPNTINLHALRHTYATRLLERGESLKTIQEILGHTDISITANIYTDVLLETKKKAAAKMDGLLARK